MISRSSHKTARFSVSADSRLHRTMQSSAGFTLVELMIALVVAAVLIGIGVPTFGTLISQNRVRTTTMDLQSAISLARSEALKRNRTVVLNPAGGGWSTGWVIPSPTPDEPDILNHVQASGTDITGPLGAVSFSASGRATAPADFEITAPSGTGSNAHCLRLGLDGRATSAGGGC